ncbi:MAG TPA: DUF1254 domain-containing protein [Syntrophorhabdaceae bacterium]|nr:DUF1254 domain-containing protein [Syntrophorhabdaceae bacterium]
MHSAGREMRRWSFLLIGWAISGIVGITPVKASDLNDRELSALANKAYVYSFPVYETYRIRYMTIYGLKNPTHGGFNQFEHARKLGDHTFRTVTAPNNDTLYSSAWLNLSEEPLILSVPDTAGRYYSMAFMDFYTNNFAYVGRRATGTKAGDYVVVGPQWEGPLPPGLTVIKSPTNAVYLLGRILVDGEGDLPSVRRLQDQYGLTPLSVWTKTAVHKPPTPLTNPPCAPDPKDPWNFFKIVNLGLTENPPPADEAPLMADFAKIGVGPNQTFDPDRFNPAQRRIILKAMADASEAIRRGFPQNPRLEKGWNYPSLQIGNYGKNYQLRAAVALVGLFALEPKEAYYFGAQRDRDGNPLSGEKRYRLHFNRGELPPVQAFWSLSMYEIMPDQRGFFADNPIHRYSIGDRTRGLTFNPDGSLDIYMQRNSPGREKESNWLPTPAGRFRVSFRAYQPGQAILNGTYVMPGIESIE